jgi:hypothetical protein
VSTLGLTKNGGQGDPPQAPPKGAGGEPGGVWDQVVAERGRGPSSPVPEPRGNAPETNSSETAGVLPRPAAPRLTLNGGGGTNQRATSPFRFQAPDARLTPRAPRAPIGYACRRSGQEAGRTESTGRRGGVAPRLPAPRSASRPFSRRSASFLPSSAPSVFRAHSARRLAGVPRALTDGWGRQSAGGRVPAPRLRRRIGGARGRGGRRVYRAAAAAEKQLASLQLASAERAARRWVRCGRRPGRRAEADVGWRRGRGARDREGGGRARACGEEGRRRPHPLLGGRRPGPLPFSFRFAPRAGLLLGLGLGAGQGGGLAARSVFSSASDRPFPSSPPSPPPSHRKRKEQKVPGPPDLTGRDLAPRCR